MSNPPPEGLLALDGNLLVCPCCGGTGGTHVNTAYVSARQEDHEPQEIHVHGITGEVTHETIEAPVGNAIGRGRRNRIALTGWCDMCQGEFAIIFTQHKGQTYVETQSINPAPIYETGKNCPL
jgi:hypothetical protein